MTDKKKQAGKPPKKPPSADDSGSHLLLVSMKRSYADPELPAATEEEATAHAHEQLEGARKAGDTIPPWSNDAVRRSQIEAWNNMAQSMIDVVRTVRDSARQNERTVEHVRLLVILAMVVVTVGGVITWYHGKIITAAITDSQVAIQSQLTESNKRQEIILNAFVEIAQAQALAIEASADSDPDKVGAAQVAATKAHATALEAKRDTTSDPTERADAVRKIRQLQQADAGINDDGEPVRE